MTFPALLCTCAACSLVNPLGSFAQATFSFNVQQPPANAIVGNQLFVQVAVTSTYEVQTVSAAVEGETSNLVFSSTAPGWTNTLPLVGMPRGQKTLIITAIDVFGNSAQTQRVFLKDLPPTLAITEPRIGTVARPQFQINVSATDDDPAGAVINVYAGASLLATGTNGLNTLASIVGNDGQPVDLRFEAVDSVGQTTSIARTVYVFTNTNWLELARVGGPIMDVATNSILFVDGNALKTRSRLSGAETVLVNEPDITPSVGELTPQGAMFSTPTIFSEVYEVRSGTLIDLGPGQLQSVQGNYAIWITLSSSGATLLFRDLLAATNAVVSSGVGWGANLAPNLAPNGDVVYTAQFIQYVYDEVYRYRYGTNSQLANGSYYFTYSSVGSDGTNVVYEKDPYPYPGGSQVPGYAAMFDGVTETILATNSYQSGISINQGWIAFAEYGPSGVPQIWTRSPSGALAQQSFFGTPSGLVAVAPGGELIFYNGGHLYLARAGSAPLDLGAWYFWDFGKIFWQAGRWYAQLGRSLFVVAQPVVITSASWLSSGQFRLLLSGNVGDPVITEASTNLTDWSAIATNTVTNVVFEVVDPAPVRTRNTFYRACVPGY